MRGRTRLAGVLATIALAAGMTLAATGTARADIIPPVAQWAEIYSPYLNGQGFSVCLDDPSGSTSSGTVLQLFHCHGYASNGAPQRWVFIQPEDSNGNLIYDDGHPIYEIYSSAGGLCLTAPNLAVGTQLTLGTCNRATATGQIWWELPSVNSPAGPYFQIFPWPLDFTYNRCVSAANLSGSNGTRLMMEPCDPSNSARIFALG